MAFKDIMKTYSFKDVVMGTEADLARLNMNVPDSEEKGVHISRVTGQAVFTFCSVCNQLNVSYSPYASSEEKTRHLLIPACVDYPGHDVSWPVAPVPKFRNWEF